MTMTSSQTPPAYKPGDLLKVSVIYTNHRRSKARPAVVVSVQDVQRSRHDVIVVPISRRAGSQFADRPLRDWKAASLNEQTYIKGIIQTVEVTMVERVWGRLTDYDLDQVRATVRDVLDV